MRPCQGHDDPEHRAQLRTVTRTAKSALPYNKSYKLAPAPVNYASDGPSVWGSGISTLRGTSVSLQYQSISDKFLFTNITFPLTQLHSLSEM